MRRIKIKKGAVLAVLISMPFVLLVAFKGVDFKTSKSLDIFFSLYRELNVFYVDKPDPEKLILVGINSMLESLDPYNEFIPEEDKEQFEFQTTGEYGGMGALIRHAKEYPIVSEIYEGSPSQKAGIMVGDTIKWIDSVDVRGLSVERVSSMLKGTPNTLLSIVVRRYGHIDSLVFRFMRERIHVPSVPYHGIIDSNIGYVRMSGFTNDSHKEVQIAVNDLINDKKAQGIILDLRGNPGGLLNEAVKTVNLFVGKNQLVVFTKGQIKEFDKDYITTSKPLDEKIPLVVLVDRSSASAAEIVAGALQDLDRAVVIGERTFGKGLVQATRPLPYNSQLKVTIAKYYIPSGRCIQAVDFSSRNEDGSVNVIPDSLVKEFKTKNGRPVFDGGGISPDINYNVSYYSRIAGALYSNNMFFDFATRFRSTRTEISEPTSFGLSPQEYNDFLNFLTSQKFDYQSQTETAFNQLIEFAKQEKYYSISKPLMDSLQTIITTNRMKDLVFFEDEIKTLLEEEIVSRYYFQKGRSEFALKNDGVIPVCIDLLLDRNRYNEILSVGKPN